MLDRHNEQQTNKAHKEGAAQMKSNLRTPSDDFMFEARLPPARCSDAVIGPSPGAGQAVLPPVPNTACPPKRAAEAVAEHAAGEADTADNPGAADGKPMKRKQGPKYCATCGHRVRGSDVTLSQPCRWTRCVPHCCFQRRPLDREDNLRSRMEADYSELQEWQAVIQHPNGCQYCITINEDWGHGGAPFP
jgi:hypothetical protein